MRFIVETSLKQAPTNEVLALNSGRERARQAAGRAGPPRAALPRGRSVARLANLPWRDDRGRAGAPGHLPAVPLPELHDRDAGRGHPLSSRPPAPLPNVGEEWGEGLKVEGDSSPAPPLPSVGNKRSAEASCWG